MENMMNELTINHKKDEIRSRLTDGYALLELARGWLGQGNAVVALELLKSAQETKETESDQLFRAQLLKETGRAYMMMSDWDASTAYYREGQHLFTDIGQYKGAAECARNSANMYFQQGNFEKSEQLCNVALQFSSEIDDHGLRATILNTLGAIKSATGNNIEAIKILKLCLSDFEITGNRIRQGYVLLNIGMTYIELADYTKAIADLNQALAIALEEKDLNLLEICYQNISKCYLAQNEIKLAKSVIDTARKILPGLNSIALEAELNLIDCKLLRLMGNTNNAESLLQQTYHQALEHKLGAVEAELLFEFGLLEKGKGNNSMATVKLDAALAIYKNLSIEQGIQKTVRELDTLKRRQNA